MDFDKAIAAHSAWKQKLSIYLAKPDKSIEAAKLEKDNLCDLGKWIYAEEQKLAGNATFSQLKTDHANFHRAAAAVVIRADAGKSVSEEISLGSSSPYAACSAKVVQALMKMRRESTGAV